MNNLDAARFRSSMDALGAALRRPLRSPSTPDGGLPPPVAKRITESLTLVGDAAQRCLANGPPGGATFLRLVDVVAAGRIKSLLVELADLRAVRVTMAVGVRRSVVLRDLLSHAVPNLLGVIRKLEDENAHSDVLRWCLDAREAPTVAPVLLRALASRLPSRDRWLRAISRGLETNSIVVRREVVVGHWDGDLVNLDRIDLVLTGPGFVLAIENKVQATEHEGQTVGYGRWLQSIPNSLTAGVFLSPTGVPAASSYFVPASYLELATWLLEAAATSGLTTTEHHLLCGYFKTLESGILKTEIRAIRRIEEHS